MSHACNAKIDFSMLLLSSSQLKNQPISDYFLVTRNVDGEKFEKKINLHLNSKKCSVFVQTDKSTYKPSDKIQFRVLLVDADTKPFESSNVQIYITDGAQNRVKQFSSPIFCKGVFQDELQLSDSPVMGNWTINVKVPDADYEMEKSFEVAEYVLPKFEVIVDSNPHVALKDGKINATVSGKYTFGKLAKGKAKVTAKVVNNSYFYCYRPEPSVKVIKLIDVDGKKDVQFDIKSELELKEIFNDVTVQIEATFTEELTGLEYSGSTSVTIHKTAHKIELIKSNEKIKPGLPFKVTAVVKSHNNAPVTDSTNKMEFLITSFHQIKSKEDEKSNEEKQQRYYGYQPERSEEKTEKVVLANGIAELNIEVPSDTIRISVKASYLETEESLHNIEKSENECNQFIQAKVLTER